MKTKIFALIILMAILLSACGTPAVEPLPESPSDVPVEAPSEAVTLQIYLLDYTPETIEWLEEEINPAFEAAHPVAKVEITQGSSWSGWDTTFTGFFTAGKGPDIINLVLSAVAHNWIKLA